MASVIPLASVGFWVALTGSCQLVLLEPGATIFGKRGGARRVYATNPEPTTCCTGRSMEVGHVNQTDTPAVFNIIDVFRSLPPDHVFR